MGVPAPYYTIPSNNRELQHKRRIRTQTAIIPYQVINMVVMLVNRLSEKSEMSGTKKLSEDELAEEFAGAIQKSDKRATKPARAVSKSMREKYTF